MTLITCSNGAVIDYALANAISLQHISKEKVSQGFSRLKLSIGDLDDPEIVAIRKKEAKERKLLEAAMRNLAEALDRSRRYAEPEKIVEFVTNYVGLSSLKESLENGRSKT